MRLRLDADDEHRGFAAGGDDEDGGAGIGGGEEHHLVRWRVHVEPDHVAQLG